MNHNFHLNQISWLPVKNWLQSLSETVIMPVVSHLRSSTSSSGIIFVPSPVVQMYLEAGVSQSAADGYFTVMQLDLWHISLLADY